MNSKGILAIGAVLLIGAIGWAEKGSQNKRVPPVGESAKGQSVPGGMSGHIPYPSRSESFKNEMGRLLKPFLTGADVEFVVANSCRGEELRSTIEKYYENRAPRRFEAVTARQFLQEDSHEDGAYRVFLVSLDGGARTYPVMIREEEGAAKVDWESFIEFFDEHYVDFLESSEEVETRLRLVIERVESYPGKLGADTPDLAKYWLYRVNPPYGGLNEYSRVVFLKSDSDAASRLDEVVGVNDDALAVIVELKKQESSNGEGLIFITDYCQDGWLE